MTSSGDRSGHPRFPIRESRSLHDLFSGFFFNHVDHSRTTTTGHQKGPPFWGGGGGGDEGVSSDSSAVALVFSGGGGGRSSSDVDESRLIDSMAEVTCAVKSSRMRRSDTLDDSLLRKSDDPVFQPEDVLPPPPSDPPASPLPSVRSTSGVISFTASASGGETGTGSGLRGLLADIFNTKGTTGSRSRSNTSAGSDPASDASASRHSASTLTLGSSGGGGHCPTSPAAAAAADDFSLLPTSPKHLSKVRRQLTLPAVLEGDPGSFEVAEKNRITHLDINHNEVVPKKTSQPQLQGTNSPPPTSPYGIPTKVSEADLALPEPMKTPPPHPRKFGILDLFAAGERKSVRNRDVNAMAPQSW